MGQGILGSVRFGVFENCKSHVAEFQGIEKGSLDLTSKAFCAGIAGIATSFFLVILMIMWGTNRAY